MLCIKALDRQVEPCTRVLFQLENRVTITKTCKKAFSCNRNVKIQLQWVLHRFEGPKCLESQRWHSHHHLIVLKKPRKTKIVSVPVFISVYISVSVSPYQMRSLYPAKKSLKYKNLNPQLWFYSRLLFVSKHLWCNSIGRNVCPAPRYHKDLGSKGRKVPWSSPDL